MMTTLNFRRWLSLLMLLIPFSGIYAQFHAAAGEPGSTAIAADDSRFVMWAYSCNLIRGWQDMADTTLGKTSVGDEQSCIGKANENGVVSLGDGGIAILTFPFPITNGPGADFAVFENGFPTGVSPLAFLEFAFVEVSSDGERFVRFPAESYIQDTIQLPMVGIDASSVHNLAGKYVYGYGTPFDLEELNDSARLDVSRITHIRVVDVIGSINERYATYDIHGRKINDPYPTPFPSGGFDLDAVGVIHAYGISSSREIVSTNVKAYPNPASGNEVMLQADESWSGATVLLTDINGRQLHSSIAYSTSYPLNIRGIAPGLYFLNIQKNGISKIIKLIIE